MPFALFLRVYIYSLSLMLYHIVILYQGRGSRGAMGATCLHSLEAVGAPPPPQLSTVNAVHFYLFVFAREFGSLPKNSGPNPESF